MNLSFDAFEKLALEQLDLLYRLARRMTGGSPDRAADLVQETYLRAFRGRESFNLHEHGIRPWLIRIMHNLHITRGEREARQPTSMDFTANEPSGESTDPGPAISTDLLQNLDGELVHALDQLAEEYRVVMMLWAVEDFSYREIADALNVPIGTVMSRLHRARERLSHLLRGFALQEGIIRE